VVHATYPAGQLHAPLAQTFPPEHVNPEPHPPQLVALALAFVVSLMQVPPQLLKPDGHCTVTGSLVFALALVAPSATLTLTVTPPGAVYVCDPVIVNAPADPVIVPADVEPSPQSMSAVSAPAPSAATASVTLATEPENAAPSTGAMAVAVAVSCTLQTPETHVCALAHAYDEPQPPQFASSFCSLTQRPLHAVGVEPPQVLVHPYAPASPAEHAIPPAQFVPQAPQVAGSARDVPQPAPPSPQSA
jgi:hypothetical protein